MQTIDDRESRIRNSFRRLEDQDGKIEKQTMQNLLMVKNIFQEINLNFLLDQRSNAHDRRGSGGFV